jgi:hypothetical protein
MSVGGMGPCLALEGPSTREVFKTYLEGVLAPSLRPGQVIVMDNLSSHKGQGREDQGDRRAEGLRAGLPAALLARSQPHRRSLRQAQGAARRSRRTHPRGSLIEAMGRALEALRAKDARGFFEHRGYHAAAQLL